MRHSTFLILVEVWNRFTAAYDVPNFEICQTFPVLFLHMVEHSVHVKPASLLCYLV